MLFGIDPPEFSLWQFFLAVALFFGAVGTMLAFAKAWIVDPIAHRVSDMMDEKLEDNRTVMTGKIDEKLLPVQNKLEDIEADVADIRHEVNANGGKSLKDLALKTREDVAVLNGRFKDHLDQHHQQGEQ